MRAIIYIALFLFGTAISQAQKEIQASDKELITDAEYKVFLLQIETALPKWETSLKNIMPEKYSNISYRDGKSIASQKDLGLMQIKNLRFYIAREKIKRTVYGELAIDRFIESLFSAGQEMTWLEVVLNLPTSDFEKYAPELGEFSIRIGNDVMPRVKFLEEGICQQL